MKLKFKILCTALMLSATTVFAQEGFRTIGGKKCQLYKVITKDTWTGLSRKYNMSIDELKAVNPGINELKIGQIINIPIEVAAPEKEDRKPESSIKSSSSISKVEVKPSPTAKEGTIHTIEKGETLFAIARKYNVSANDIKSWNHIANADGIKAGDKLIVSAPVKTITAPAANNKEIARTEPIVQPLDDSKLEAKNNEVKNDSKLIAEAGNKMIPVTPNANEIEYKPSRTEVKRSGGKTGSIIEVNESGMASWIRDGDINQSKFYALHRTAPAGTIIKVSNRMNGDYVFVKVVGSLPDTGDNDKQIIKISEAAAKRIGAINEKFQVELNYGVTN